MSTRISSLCLVCLLSLVLVAGTATALPSITIDVAGGDPAASVVGDGTFVGPDGGGVTTWTLDESQDIIEGGDVLGRLNSWTVQSKEDPFVTNNINITNTTNSTQTYMATVFLPIPAFNYHAVISSSVGATITDSDNSGTMTLAEDGGTAFYRGQVNGGTELTLNPGTPLTLADCPTVFAGCSATDSDGTAFLAVVPGVANDIALVLRFQLSSMDSVGITSRFEIVPEPVTGVLFGMGLVGIAIAGRRRG